MSLAKKLHYLNNKLIFVIENPLVTPIDYTLYHIIPLPTKFANHHMFILSRYEHLAVSSDKAFYIPQNNWNLCSTLLNAEIICPLNQPIFSTSGNTICEYELIFNVNQLLKKLGIN